eukprot:gnl/MRDRNA2_/MRDRNA2_90306_c0_seq1.p1 gnl/MRDRNA2_/MRDRNA2_90306_c0~~gnl/MRDRNA2_/MRDRNA2_90306_c0_seq1.p1  ORF type:complete len:308 (+),score=41.77 gnl/MRDRNA2_/MRDRNA2_90306_c0_seq1:59-982(+)
MRSTCLLHVAVIALPQCMWSLRRISNVKSEVETLPFDFDHEDEDIGGVHGGHRRRRPAGGYLWQELCHRAHFEERNLSGNIERDIPCDGHHRNLYPRSWYEKAMALNHEKTYNFNFMGKLDKKAAHIIEKQSPDLEIKPSIEELRRKWVPDFVRNHFGKHDYYRNTYPEENYQVLGEFDHSLERIPFLENTAPQNYEDYEVPFDTHYFTVLAQSNFTLCPAGDRVNGFTSRFFEAMMAKSICILQSAEHAGGHEDREISKKIGWHFYVLDEIEANPETLIYHSKWADENLANFRKYHTLMDGNNDPQ